MSRARDLGLSIAIAFSILSASALSGEQSGDAFSFLGALQVKPLPFATAKTQLAETSRPASTGRKPEILNSINPVLARADRDISLEARRQAFIARVVGDLSSKSPKDKLALAVTGETQ
ncbi:MAG: hypothetical protein ACO20O_07170 [Pseudomonadales bacterium]